MARRLPRSRGLAAGVYVCVRFDYQNMLSGVAPGWFLRWEWTLSTICYMARKGCSIGFFCLFWEEKYKDLLSSFYMVSDIKKRENNVRKWLVGHHVLITIFFLDLRILVVHFSFSESWLVELIFKERRASSKFEEAAYIYVHIFQHKFCFPRQTNRLEQLQSLSIFPVVLFEINFRLTYFYTSRI